MLESSICRLLKAHDLVTSCFVPAFVVTKAADELREKIVRPNQLWQTDFTYLKVTGWGCYLSTILDDDSRYVVTWRLCTTMVSIRNNFAVIGPLMHKVMASDVVAMLRPAAGRMTCHSD